MKHRNALYTMLSEYLSNQPGAKPAHAWRHFIGLANGGLAPVLVAADPLGSWIEVIPDRERVRTKRVSRSAFHRNLLLIRSELGRNNS